MTLTTRLSLFFLATLAFVLVGFSTALYFLARQHLQEQAGDRVDAALHTLAAAAEVGPDSVEWEPAERHFSLGSAVFGDQIAWVVQDDQGAIVDRSKSAELDEFLAEVADHLPGDRRSGLHADWQGDRWQGRRWWIEPAGQPVPLPPQKDDGRKYAALSITVGVSLEPVRATLRSLAGVLVGLSLGVWLLAFFVGRVVCRRALLPVTRMAVAVRDMDADDLARRLPAASTGDEVADLSQAFNLLLDRLQESFERQKRFTGDASHQLRTPLAAMLGQIEVTLRRERPPEEYQRALTTLHGQTERLRRIVDSLLFLARADAEARLPQQERIDLCRWLPEHLQTWSQHPRAGDLALEEDGSISLEIEAQAGLLGELIDVLIDNACKFSEPGKPITVRLHQEQSRACMAVEDQGCGIREQDLPHLFTPFFRSADVRQRGLDGVGLGLAIAKRLADALGGDLTVTSEHGRGSCFTLKLPSVRAADSAPTAASAP